MMSAMLQCSQAARRLQARLCAGKPLASNCQAGTAPGVTATTAMHNSIPAARPFSLWGCSWGHRPLCPPTEHTSAPQRTPSTHMCNALLTVQLQAGAAPRVPSGGPHTRSAADVHVQPAGGCDGFRRCMALPHAGRHIHGGEGGALCSKSLWTGCVERASMMPMIVHVAIAVAACA